MPEQARELCYQFEAPQLLRRRRTLEGQPSLAETVRCSAALPRITRLMALAIKLDKMIREHPELDGAELARRGHVSRSRVTQILNLLNLAPDIQEKLLWLAPLDNRREVITEKSVRQLSGESDWPRQRERFARLLSTRPASC